MADVTGTRDTTGVTGNPGPIPLGTQHQAANRDTAVDEGAHFSGPFADPAPVAEFQTSAGSGYDLPTLADYSQVDLDAGPVDTSYTGVLDTTMPGVQHVQREYRAPSEYVPGEIFDTSWTDVHGVGYHVDREIPLQYYYLIPDTYHIAAGAPGLLGEESIILNAEGEELSEESIYQGTFVVKTDGGKTDARQEILALSVDGVYLPGRGIVEGSVEVSHVVDGGEGVTLTNNEAPVDLNTLNILTPLGDIVVEFDSNTLTAGDDYVLSERDEDGDRVVSIAWVDGSTALPTGEEEVNVQFQVASSLSSGDDYNVEFEGTGAYRTAVIYLDDDSEDVEEGSEVSVSYELGGYGYFFPQRLVEGIDYRLEYSAGVTTIYPVEGSERASEGDDVTVTYLYGSEGTYNSRLPEDVPNVPQNPVALARDRELEVQWDHPAGGEFYDGFVVETSNSHAVTVSDNDGVEGASTSTYSIHANGLMYTSASETMARLRFLEPDRHLNEHDSGNEVFGTYEDYVFRVAAVNKNGVGPFTSWTSPSTSPYNHDQNPPSSIPRRNRVNPIYRADGTVVPGTGLGA